MREKPSVSAAFARFFILGTALSSPARLNSQHPYARNKLPQQARRQLHFP